MAGERFYEAPAGGDSRRSAPAALRNRAPIAEVLKEWLPASGLVLEIASGSGEHALCFAQRFPALDWQPSDAHPSALGSIRAWRDSAALPNLREPLMIDAAAPWPISTASAVLNINMAHISPWSATLGLLDGAARVLGAGSPLILYGPWISDDIPTAPSNLSFDADLRARDPQWGLRRIEELADAAGSRGCALIETRMMPANNRMILLRRSPPR